MHGSSSEVTDQPSWVVKVDVEREPTLAALFDARSIPLLVLMRDGREVDRIIGALPSRRTIGDELADLRDGVRAARLEQVLRELRRRRAHVSWRAILLRPRSLGRLGDIERELAEAGKTDAHHTR